MIKRIKRLWALSRKDEDVIKSLEALTEEQIAELPNAVKGNGKAVFFDEGSSEDYLEQERSDAGMSKWYKRIKNL